jgi:hypothetical protein
MNIPSPDWLAVTAGISFGLALFCAYHWYKAARANVEQQIRHGQNVAELVARILRLETANDRLEQQRVRTVLSLEKARADIAEYTNARRAARFVPAARRVVTELAESGASHADVSTARLHLIGEDGL